MAQWQSKGSSRSPVRDHDHEYDAELVSKLAEALQRTLAPPADTVAGTGK